MHSNFNTQKRPNYPLIIVIMIYLCACIASGIIFLWNEIHTSTLDRIEKIIGINVPANATNLSYGIEGWQDHTIFVSFDIPFHHGDNFSSHFCDGKLIQGYDPLYDPMNFYGRPGPNLPPQPPGPLVYGLHCDWTYLVVDRRSFRDHVELVIFQ